MKAIPIRYPEWDEPKRLMAIPMDYQLSWAAEDLSAEVQEVELHPVVRVVWLAVEPAAVEWLEPVPWQELLEQEHHPVAAVETAAAVVECKEYVTQANLVEARGWSPRGLSSILRGCTKFDIEI